MEGISYHKKPKIELENNCHEVAGIEQEKILIQKLLNIMVRVFICLEKKIFTIVGCAPLRLLVLLIILLKMRQKIII
jgi:hypothetical protein